MNRRKRNIQQPKVWYKDKWNLGAFIILIVTFLIFSPAIQYNFVNWDDDVNVAENKNVTTFNVSGIFTESVIGGYNPLSILSLAIDYKLANGEPWLFHLNNILLHLLCTLLVFVLLKRLGISFFISLVVTILFGIHPMRIESVVWITERKDVLFGLFYLLSLILYLDFAKNRKTVFFVLSILAFILSLLSKIQAVTLPFSLLLVDYWLNRKLNIKLLMEKLPFFVLSLITGLVGIYFLRQQGSLETGEIFPFHQRLFIGSYSFMVYILKSVIPFHLSALHPYTSKLNVLYYLSMIPTILIFIIPLFSYKKNKYITFGILFFIANIIFMLQVLGAGQGFLAERFTYIPYIGLFLIYAKFAETLLTDFYQYKTTIYSILALYIVVLGVITINQRNTWKDSITLWDNVIEKYPTNSLAYNNLGHYYRQQNNYELALLNYNNAIKNDPKNDMAYANRGKVWFDQGQVDKAIDDYNKSIELDNKSAETFSNRGAALGMTKKYDAALADLDYALELEPNNLNALSNRGFVYYNLGDFQKTIQDYSQYLQFKPNDADILNTIGLCYSNLKDFDKAIATFTKCITINPQQGAFYNNRSYALNGKGDKANALKDALQAQNLGFKVPENYMNFLRMDEPSVK
jgi:tetratricopeptide (TPR) repeat protein